MSFLFPNSLWNHAQLEGGSGVERLMNTLAYGWVECCSNIASCETASSSKISIMSYYFCNVFVYEYSEYSEFLLMISVEFTID